MQLRTLYFYLTALLPLFIARSAQASPVGLAYRRDLEENGADINGIYTRG